MSTNSSTGTGQGAVTRTVVQVEIDRLRNSIDQTIEETISEIGVGLYGPESSTFNAIVRYDDASGTLASIPTGKYVKHSLYISGEGDFQKHFFVYGQEVFDTLVEAQGGGIPSAPSFFGSPTPLIATIIVQQGVTNIEQIRDNRPTLGFKAEGVSATSVHGNLSGLGSDDHPQYLLVNGSREMSGDLNMDGNDLVNVGTINSITLATHASRHIPNGSDPLPTGAPDVDLSATSTNDEGIQNTFARSDHTHAIETHSDNTVSSIVARDENGDFAAGVITATEFVGDLTGNAASCTDFSGNLDGDVTGTQSTTVIASGAITNAKVASNAAIVDTKLATISTAGKVSNSATTATSANTASAIVARNASGNFSAGTITANLTGNVTGNLTGNVTGNADTATSATSATSATTATTATNFSGSLSGDVTGTQGATVLANSVVTNAKVSATAAIVDTKLATISTAGKVSNSATTATSDNTVSAIVARDSSGNFSAGTITANLTGNVTGNADTATTTANFSGNLAGDVSGTQGATVLANGVVTNAKINASANIADTKLATISTAGKVANSATTATSANTASAIVARDASGNFVAGTITAALTGNADTATTATNFSGSLSGDVTGTQGSTTIASGVITNAKINASAAIADTKLATISTSGKVANSATTAASANTASAIVARDASGNFSAGTITAALSGNATTATTATNFSGSLTGDVTGTQGATAIASGAINNAKIASDAAIVDTKLATISTAGKVNNSATTATSSNTINSIVTRDSSGNFSAGTISAALNGNALTSSDGLSSASGTAPLTLTLNSKSLTGSVSAATTSNAGTMSAADKLRLDNLPNILYNRVTLDQSTTTQVAANVTNMTFAIGASEVWQFEFVVFGTSAGGGGMKFAITVPTSATLRAGGMGNASGTANQFQSDQYTVSGTLGNAYLAANGAVGMARIAGVCVNSTNAGSVTLQFANVSGSQSMTVKVNSYVLAHKIA